MARTRACKARPRPPSRNTIGRVTPRRGSTVESLRASVTSIEGDASTLRIKQQAPGTRSYLHNNGEEEEEDMVKIKQEDDDTTEPTEVKTWPKRRAQEPTPKASLVKKHKPSPPVSAARITRSKTLPYRNETRGIQSDSESESDIKTHNNAKTPSVNSPLHLLRPYMAFQLSVSGLSGKAYKAAEASMKSVLNVAENFEKECGGALTRTQDSLSSNSSEDNSEEHKPQPRPKQRVDKKLYKMDSLASKTEEDVLPRKQRELNEQTRKRLAKERRARHDQQRRDRDSSNQSSSSSPSSETATDLAGDTEDDAKYPPNNQLSVSTTTSFYNSRRASTTDSTETSSEGEESDVIERREKNALRRRKAKQKRWNACKREGEEEGAESESEPETEVDVVLRNKEEKEEIRTPVLTDRDYGKDVMVDFCPIAW